jgi:lipoprotein-anchoring transpeptidase ErfK/SrfK
MFSSDKSSHPVGRLVQISFVLFFIAMLSSGCQVNMLSQRASPTENVPALPTQTVHVPLSQPTFPQAPDTTDAANKLKEFQGVLHIMQQNGEDITTYQQIFNTDRAALKAAKTTADLKGLSGQIASQMTPGPLPLAQALAQYLVSQFHQDVTTWGQQHQFHDTYDGKSYPLDFEYEVSPQYYSQYDYGEGAQLDDQLQTATLLSDYQNVITQVNTDQVLLGAMKSDANDPTAWNQAHATDQQVMNYYHITQGHVIAVSFYEQVLRVYQDGKLVKAVKVSTGQYYRPTILGYYQIVSHQAQSTFYSFESSSSPLYFPTTVIQDAMGFGDPSAGYFFHASPWRTYYGMNTDFPHDDPDNANSESRNGSHGCVNLPIDEAQWLFNTIQDGANVVLY